MRKTIWMMALALAAGGACKKTETEKAATEVRKAQENVQEQREDVRDEAKDVRDEARDIAKEANKEANDVVEEGKDVAKEGKELTDAERKLESARARLQSSVRGRLAAIDGKLATLDGRVDPVSKKLAADLRARRDVVSNRLNAVDSIAIANWDAYEDDVEDNMKVLENDLDKALDTKEKPERSVPLDRTDTTPVTPNEPMTR